jgi:putative MFS transporter
MTSPGTYDPRRAPGHATDVEIAGLNARIDRLPVWGLSWAVFAVVGLSYFFAFYDISTISYTLPVISKQLGLSGYALALPVTANLAGYVIGAYVLGNFADVIGRRAALLITVAIMTVGGILTALSWNGASLDVFRFITGLGMGSEIALAATILTEFSPASTRGRNLQLNYLWGAVGLAVTPFVAIGLLKIPGAGWRLVFLVGALVAFVTIFIRGRYLPESPRWLVTHGRADEAEELVARMEETARQRSGQKLAPASEVPPEATFKGFPTMALLRPPYRRRLAVTLGFWLVWYITVYAYLGYEPTLLIKMGLSEPSGLLFSALGDIAIPVGAVVALLMVERWQRKYLVAIVAFVFTAALLVMAVSSSGGLLFVGAFFSSMMVAANSVAYVYTAESFPTRARATATSIGDGVGHIGGVVAPFIVVTAMSGFGARWTFTLLAAIVLISGLIISLGGIKTTGAELTRVAR